MSSRTSKRTRAFATLTTAACVVAVTLLASGAGAAIVATVPLGTAGAQYAALAGARVTNTGLRQHPRREPWPGTEPTSVTGFPPGPPGAPRHRTIDNAGRSQAKADLTVAYDNAAGRPPTPPPPPTTGLHPAGRRLRDVQQGRALLLSGPLTLDGAGNADSVFIFQTDSTLTTGSVQHGEPDQRGPGVQRLLAGRQLRHSRHEHPCSSANTSPSPSITVNPR